MGMNDQLHCLAAEGGLVSFRDVVDAEKKRRISSLQAIEPRSSSS
jgi:hypothetical protein